MDTLLNNGQNFPSSLQDCWDQYDVAKNTYLSEITKRGKRWEEEFADYLRWNCEEYAPQAKKSLLRCKMILLNHNPFPGTEGHAMDQEPDKLKFRYYFNELKGVSPLVVLGDPEVTCMIEQYSSLMDYLEDETFSVDYTKPILVFENGVDASLKDLFYICWADAINRLCTLLLSYGCDWQTSVTLLNEQFQELGQDRSDFYLASLLNLKALDYDKLTLIVQKCESIPDLIENQKMELEITNKIGNSSLGLV